MDLFDLDVTRHLEMLRGNITDSFGYGTDKHLSQYALGSNFQNDTHVRRGRVQLAMPHFGWYRVAVEGLVGILPCCKLSPTGSGLFSPIDTAMLPTDCSVWVALHKSSRYGYILGVIPTETVDGNYCFSDFVFQGSHVGFRDEYLSSYISLTADSGGVIDFSSNRPVDNLATDWGVATSTGAMLHVDPCLVMLRISEACGVFGFYPEGLLRVAGRTLQTESDVHVTECANDEGESVIYRGEAAFPWEARGWTSEYAEPVSTTDDAEVMLDRLKGKYEPDSDDAEPIWRYEEYGGYLGQGHIRQMSVPFNVDTASGQIYSDDEAHPTCVFREHIGLDGSWNISSAKALRLLRQVFPAHPRRRRQITDGSAKADAIVNEGYSASGVNGHGTWHLWGDLYEKTAFTALIGALDRVAYETNERSLLGFYYHTADNGVGDFTLPEIEDSWQTPLPFEELQAGQGFTSTVDDPAELKIDIRRDETTKFARLLQMLEFSDDGGVILQGGHGEQISFVRGEIYIDAPSNIHFRSGKSVITLAGDDAIIRARNSVDVTAAEHDVRIKAEVNFHTLSGNSGHGGTLHENRAVSTSQSYSERGGEDVASSGIVFKAARSNIMALSGGIYLRTGDSTGGVSPGDIVLDAGKGASNVVTLASTHHRFATNGYSDSFGDSVDKVVANNVFTRLGCNLTGSTAIAGHVSITQGITVRSGIMITQGHISSRSGGHVGVAPPTADNYLQIVESTQKTWLEKVGALYRTHSNQYYSSVGLGSAEVQKSISFGYRTVGDYNTETLRIPQAYWQRLADNSGAVTAWKEPAVAYREPGNKTYPWPGTRWTETSMLRLHPAVHPFYTQTVGTPNGRSYPEHPQLGALQSITPNTSYTVIKS